MIFKIT